MARKHFPSVWMCAKKTAATVCYGLRSAIFVRKNTGTMPTQQHFAATGKRSIKTRYRRHIASGTRRRVAAKGSCWKFSARITRKSWWRTYSTLGSNKRLSTKTGLTFKICFFLRICTRLLNRRQAGPTTIRPALSTSLRRGGWPTDDGLRIEAEFDDYIAQPLEVSDADPTKWWIDNSSKFPFLSPVALGYLVYQHPRPVERVFSRAGFVYERWRHSLSSDMLQATFCLQSWWAPLDVDSHEIVSRDPAVAVRGSSQDSLESCISDNSDSIISDVDYQYL